MYFGKNGASSAFPFSRQEARKVRSKIYTGEECSICGTKDHYTKTDICVRCSKDWANDLFCYAAGAIKFERTNEGVFVIPGPMVKTVKKHLIPDQVWIDIYTMVDSPNCLFMKNGVLAKSEYDASRLGLSHYLVPVPCEMSGHFGVLTISGKCSYCESESDERILARQRGEKYYTPGQPCTRCGHTAERRTSDNRCTGCFPVMRKHVSDIARIDARNNGKIWYTPLTPCRKCGEMALRRVSDNRCSACSPLLDTNVPRALARSFGQKWYIPEDPCPRCGKIVRHRVNDDKCNGCYPAMTDRDTESPRQAALRAGKKWYVPKDPCPRCGMIADRRVSDGQCQGCVPQLDRETSIMMEAAPDMVVSRDDARRLGLKVYRTGDACQRGHRGFRWVSTGGCIECLKGR